MNAIEIITLQEAKAILNCRDTRTVENFCRRNDILIYQEKNGKYRYVFKSDFIWTRNTVLKAKDGSSLNDAVGAFNKNYAEYLLNIDEQPKHANYAPVGQNEKKAHCELLALIRNTKCPKKNHCNQSPKGSNTSGSSATAATRCLGTSVGKQDCQSKNVNTGKNRGTK
jgi:hypothetical protein